MKISNFLIGFVVISLFATVFATYFAGLTTNYSTSSYYNESEYELFNKLDDVDATAQSINTTLTTIENGNAVDVIGGLLTSGYTVLKTTWTSFGVYTGIVKDTATRVNLGNSAPVFITSLTLIGFLLLMFALVAVLTGRDSI